MTTVGYGDQSPVSSSGKGLAIMMMIFGVLFTAMPLTIIGNEFYDAIEKEGGFQYLVDAESLEDANGASKVITFERVSHEYVTRAPPLYYVCVRARACVRACGVFAAVGMFAICFSDVGMLGRWDVKRLDWCVGM